ncbi:hypothetical protein CDD83_9407 [Cordyceps sp. RAO-2017]|nr:hypothetical protein CDD83_9407 [Cordyceps sp. RAO-2017]
MEPLIKLKRRSTGLFNQVQQSLPSLPRFHTHSRLHQDVIKGTWEPIDVPFLPRSLHSLDVVAGSAYIFGGEINPREPVDNDMHIVRLPFSGASADYYKIEAKAALPESLESRDESPGEETGQRDLDDVPLEGDALDKGKGPAAAEEELPELGHVPCARVGHATAVIGSRIFLFGGRGGRDMAPLDEAGRVWVFDTRSCTWSHLDPVSAVSGDAVIPHPEPRSYHCATAIDLPRDFARPRPRKPQTWRQWAVGDSARTGIPQNPIVGNVAEDAVDHESEGYGTFFIHAGCLASGDRTSELWAFDINSRTWTELPAAPGPCREGTAICVSKSRLFRFGGYDGAQELGGQIDFLPLELEMFDDRTTKGEVSVYARPGGWKTIVADDQNASSTDIPAEASQDWPAPRSFGSMQALTLGGGREYLVLIMGERVPSPEGHDGAGIFLNDVWVFQVPPLGMTTASFKDAMLQAVGRKTGEGRWTKVSTAPYDDATDGEPTSRGWLASAPLGDVDEGGLVIWGGLGEDNNRIGDGWILRLRT